MTRLSCGFSNENLKHLRGLVKDLPINEIKSKFA